MDVMSAFMDVRAAIGVSPQRFQDPRAALGVAPTQQQQRAHTQRSAARSSSQANMSLVPPSRAAHIRNQQPVTPEKEGGGPVAVGLLYDEVMLLHERPGESCEQAPFSAQTARRRCRRQKQRRPLRSLAPRPPCRCSHHPALLSGPVPFCTTYTYTYTPT